MNVYQIELEKRYRDGMLYGSDEFTVAAENADEAIRKAKERFRADHGHGGTLDILMVKRTSEGLL